MAEKKTTATYETIMRSLKDRHYAPVYLLMGDESFYIDKISDYIANNVIAPDDQYFNQNIVFGSDVTASQVVDLAKGYPVMPAKNRVVVVKEFQNMRSLEPLEKYIEHPVMSTILVLCYKNGVVDRRKRIVSRAESVGVVFESKRKKENELPGLIVSYLRTKRIGIDNKSAQMIADHIGSDLNRLVSELDKLAISLPEDTRNVTPEIVEHQIGVSKDFNAFELRRAIIDKDIYKANLIVNYFDKNPKAGSLYSFLPMLFNFFQNLMLAYYAPNRNNERDIAAYLDLKTVWGVRDYLIGMRNYTAMKTLQIISKIRETDDKSKGLDNPNTSAGDLMKELIFFVLH